MTRISNWDQRIAAAQLERTYVMRNRKLKRIPYGAERTRWRLRECGDCGARKGQLHVVGCDVEECPACGWQVITCGCLDCAH